MSHIILGVVTMMLTGLMMTQALPPSANTAPERARSESQTTQPPPKSEAHEREKMPAWLHSLIFGFGVAVFGGFFGGFLLWFAAISIVPLVLAWYLARRRHRNFCLTAAAIECTNAPFGTILGVMTILLLSRESVRLLFLPGSDAQTITGE